MSPKRNKSTIFNQNNSKPYELSNDFLEYDKNKKVKF